MALDDAVARASFRARQVERALHDAGPWTMVWGGRTVPVWRLIGTDRITFLGYFPANQCWLTPPEPLVELRCRGDLAGTKVIDHPGDGDWRCDWTFVVSEVAHSSASR